MRQPVIFIGMHRSGTSMLGCLLDELGLFSGNRKEENNEAIFFQKLNSWLMSQCCARWDMPEAMHYLWENKELLTWVEDYIQYYRQSPRSVSFLGVRRYLSSDGWGALNCPWGWKDPCNTITLPLWLKMFPEAKVIYIKRHGVDVAKSLLVRSEKKFKEATKKYQKYKPVVFLRPKKRGFIESPRCSSLEGGLSLWKEYNSQAIENLLQVPKERVLLLRYEDILKNPVLHLGTAASFCAIDTSSGVIADVTTGVDCSRAFSYLKNQELRDFACAHQQDLAEFGYE